MGELVSIRPSEMVEGGALPVNQNLTVKEAIFCSFDYQGKAPQTTAAKITLVNDEGQEYEQYYSVGKPDRFLPSQDGKTLIAVGTAQALSKSSNFWILMNELVNAGFPENKIGGAIDVLDGLYAYWIGMVEPKREGLVKEPLAEGQVARVPQVLVPSKIHKLPWEKGAKGAKTGAKAAAVAVGEEESVDATAAAIAFIGKVVAEVGAITRQDLAVRLFKDSPEGRDAIAAAIYAPETQGALLAAGFKVDGETISK